MSWWSAAFPSVGVVSYWCIAGLMVVSLRSLVVVVVVVLVAVLVVGGLLMCGLLVIFWWSSGLCWRSCWCFGGVVSWLSPAGLFAVVWWSGGLLVVVVLVGVLVVGGLLMVS